MSKSSNQWLNPGTQPRHNALSQEHGGANAGGVTPSTADIWTGPNSVILSMTSGPMEGMQLHCTDTSLGSCQINGGPPGTASGELISDLRGQYAYAGHFKVVHLGAGEGAHDSEIVAHAAVGDHAVNLPQGSVTYQGAFAAGVGLSDGTGGIATGTASLIANFNTAVLSGTLSGSVGDGADQTPISASFNHVAIHTASGSFASNANTVFLFQDAAATGSLNGAFYGPTANEAAGAFQIGNNQGGMTGVFLGCSGNVNCMGN